MLAEFIVLLLLPSAKTDTQTDSLQDLQLQEVHQRTSRGLTTRAPIHISVEAHIDIYGYSPETWHDVAQSRLKRDTKLLPSFPDQYTEEQQQVEGDTYSSNTSNSGWLRWKNIYTRKNLLVGFPNHNSKGNQRWWLVGVDLWYLHKVKMSLLFQ